MNTDTILHYAYVVADVAVRLAFAFALFELGRLFGSNL